jgi:hypothetical protein
VPKFRNHIFLKVIQLDIEIYAMSDSRELEILVAKIQAQLAPDAEVIHNAKLQGKHSGTSRQIDVLVRQKIGQYEMLIVLDCKDYAKPVDVKGVEEFYGLLKDVGANKGALVCPKGFTEAAKTRAAGWQIDLYSPVDTDPHKWQVRVAIPIVCDFRRAAISFGIMTSAPKPFRLFDNFFTNTDAFDDNGKNLGTPFNAAISKWNEGRFPTDPGEHKDLTIYETPEVLADNGYGEKIPVTLTVSLLVQQQLYFGYQPLARISGFKDELSGSIITNAFTLGILDPNEVDKTWQPIASENDLSVRPVVRLIGLIGWQA